MIEVLYGVIGGLVGAILGGFSGWFLVHRGTRQEKEDQADGVRAMADGFMEKERVLRADLKTRRQELEEWTRSRMDTYEEERQQLWAMIHGLQNRPSDPEERVAPDPHKLAEEGGHKVEVDELEEHQEQIRRMMRDGLTEDEAVRYLNGDLENIPDYSTRIDRMVSPAMADGLGIPLGGK